jgi:hypothetical protein
MKTILAISAAILGASSASAAIAQPSPDEERAICDKAATDWTPVRLPAAGINVAIPCSLSEVNAYKNANETRKRTDGVFGCEQAGRSFKVIYAVNTPSGFFDQFVSEWKFSPTQNFQVAGHRVFRAAAHTHGQTEGEQLIEVDVSRSILMTSSSAVPNDTSYTDLVSCFFNTLQVAQP